jgi:hypothetical protein
VGLRGLQCNLYFAHNNIETELVSLQTPQHNIISVLAHFQIYFLYFAANSNSSLIEKAILMKQRQLLSICIILLFITEQCVSRPEKDRDRLSTKKQKPLNDKEASQNSGILDEAHSFSRPFRSGLNFEE